MIKFYHGLIGSHQHFSATAAALETFDLTGSAADIPFLEMDYAEILAHFAQPSSTPTVQIGNSIGCCLAIQAAGPQDQIILTAAPFDYGRGIVPLGKRSVEDWVASLYVRHGAVQNESAIIDHAAEQVLGLISNRSQIRRLRHYKASALSFWEDPALRRHEDRITFVIGKHDFTTPVDAFSNHVQRLLPKARVLTWDNCGHAVSLDAPKRLAALAAISQRHMPGYAVPV